MSRVYLDHNATSLLRPQVTEAIVEALSAGLANPNSVHSAGQATRKRVEAAREAVAKLIGAPANDVVFCSGGTEANHLAWHEAQEQVWPCLTTNIEHSCVLAAAQKAQKRGAPQYMLHFKRRGEMSQESQTLLAEIQGLRFASLQLANNEMGLIVPTSQLLQQLRLNAPDLVVHMDAVQAVGKIAVNVKDLAVDYLSLSGHKLGALAGVGALYKRRLKPYSPLWQGGPQEKGRRPGTENTLGIIAMGAACQYLQEHLAAEAQGIQSLRDQLQDQLSAKISEVEVVCAQAPRLPNTFNMMFKAVDAQALLIAADLEGIDLSTGAACASGSLEPSHVLLALGYSQKEASSALRFSLGWNTTSADLEKVVDVLPKIINRARSQLRTS